MAHYILEAKGEPFETQHQTMYCPGIDGGDAMIVKLADYLGSLNVGSADFLRSKIRFAMSFPGYECPAAGRTP
jgi:hypothetical protein